MNFGPGPGFLPLCKNRIKIFDFCHLIMFFGQSRIPRYPKRGCRLTRWTSRWKTKVSHFMCNLDFIARDSMTNPFYNINTNSITIYCNTFQYFINIQFNIDNIAPACSGQSGQPVFFTTLSILMYTSCYTSIFWPHFRLD